MLRRPTSGERPAKRRRAEAPAPGEEQLAAALSFAGYTKVWDAEQNSVTYSIDATGEFGYTEQAVMGFEVEDANTRLAEAEKPEAWEAQWDEGEEAVVFYNAETDETFGSIDEIPKKCEHCGWEGDPDELDEHCAYDGADEARGEDCYLIHCHVCDSEDIPIGTLRQHGRCLDCETKGKGTPQDYDSWVDAGRTGVVDPDDGGRTGSFWAFATFWNGGMQRKSQYKGHVWGEFADWCSEYVGWANDDANAPSETEDGSDDDEHNYGEDDSDGVGYY